MPIFDNSKDVEVVDDPHTGEPAVPEPGHEPEQVEAVIGDDETAGEVPELDEPIQVESDLITFVAQEDFSGRINQDEFHFEKGVRYQVTRDQANTWVEAEKGYTIEVA